MAIESKIDNNTNNQVSTFFARRQTTSEVSMTEQKIHRIRGIVLTVAGNHKLQAARQEAEQTVNFGDRYTNEELSHLTRLSIKTISKIFSSATTHPTESQTPVDKQTLDLCFAAFKLILERRDYLYPDLGADPQLERAELVEQLAVRTVPQPPLPRQLCHHDTAFDCGEAPDVSIFYGRATELTQLAQWVKIDRCKLVAILGMGGIGKTALVTKLAQQLQPNFTKIVWRSLQNAPRLNQLLPEIIQICSDQTETVPPTMEISSQISRLLYYLSEQRCLLVLDNAEAILSSHNNAAEDRSPGYAELFRRIGESPHQSCLLLTSREKPEEIVPLAGVHLFVRTFTLHGLNADESDHLFNTKLLSASSVGRARLRAIYSGNPLALNIVATSICDLFDGEIDQFLGAEVSIFSGIRQLLNRQFDRLSPAEQVVMYWLAIERNWISPAALHSQIIPATTKSRLLATVESLGRKSLIEQSRGEFTQQAVVMEYMTERLIDRVIREITAGDIQTTQPPQLPLWLSYPLLEAQSPEYIQAIQTRLILEPIASQLQRQFGHKLALARHLRSILASVQTHYQGILHYGGSNLINLFRYLQIDLTGDNFAGLSLRQADLQGAELHDVNLSGADLSKSLFTSSFGRIFAVAFSPDSQLFATSEHNGDLCLWQVSTKCLLHKFKGHINWVWSIAFSPDGRVLASAGQDGTVRLWDLATRQIIRCLSADLGGAAVAENHQILSLSFHPDRQLLATGHGNSTIRLWHLPTGEIVRTQLGHTKSVLSVRFSPDGQFLATGSEDRTVKIWDVTTGDCLQTLTTHTDKVSAVRFSPDGRILATGSSDGTIQLWAYRRQIATWEAIDVLRDRFPHWLLSISFSPDSQMLAVVNSQHQVKIWAVDTEIRTVIATLCGHTALITSIQFSPNGKLLLTGSADRQIRLWDTRTWQELYRWQGYSNRIESIGFAPDGTQLVSGSQDGIVRIWDVQTGNIVQTLTGSPESIQSVDYSADGSLIASGSMDGRLRVWDAKTGKLVRQIVADSESVFNVQFSPGLQLGQQRLVASCGMDNTACLWVAATGELVTTLDGDRLIHTIGFSPDGKLLITAGFDCCWRLWDVATSQMLGCFSGHTNWIWNLAWSPDGQHLATASYDRTARLWDLATGQLLHTFDGYAQEVLTVKFSPNGQHLAVGSGDGTIKIWDIATGQLVQTLTGHLDRILALSYHPDGQLLASSSADETIKLWDITTGDCHRTDKPLPPYAGLNITGATGLTAATIDALKTLGAIEI
jgi:WD40 repeat protein/ABC-type dipeptide/oligopeptide/nickel transport system ATPase subunit